MVVVRGGGWPLQAHSSSSLKLTQIEIGTGELHTSKSWQPGRLSACGSRRLTVTQANVRDEIYSGSTTGRRMRTLSLSPPTKLCPLTPETSGGTYTASVPAWGVTHSSTVCQDAADVCIQLFVHGTLAPLP